MYWPEIRGVPWDWILKVFDQGSQDIRLKKKELLHLGALALRTQDLIYITDYLSDIV